MMAQPGAAGDPDSVIGSIDRSSAAPKIGIMIEHPAARAVVRLCGFVAGGGAISD